MEDSKKDLDPGYSEVPFPDFMDGIISDLGETVKGFRDMVTGGGLPQVQFRDMVVTIEEQDVYDDARERLEVLVQMTKSVMGVESGLSAGDIINQLLHADGWTVTRVTLRTPLWLRDVQEWPLALVECWHKELGCLEPSTSL